MRILRSLRRHSGDVGKRFSGPGVSAWDSSADPTVPFSGDRSFGVANESARHGSKPLFHKSRRSLMTTLFDPIRIGDIELPNRIVMAPLTRNRARDQVPDEMTVEYYRQRAGAGLIVTEATQISPMGQGYLDTPGIYSAEQIAAWRRVTDAVHAAGGRIVMQLWHVGRISHSSLLPDGAQPV